MNDEKKRYLQKIKGLIETFRQYEKTCELHQNAKEIVERFPIFWQKAKSKIKIKKLSNGEK